MGLSPQPQQPPLSLVQLSTLWETNAKETTSNSHSWPTHFSISAERIRKKNPSSSMFFGISTTYYNILKHLTTRQEGCMARSVDEHHCLAGFPPPTHTKPRFNVNDPITYAQSITISSNNSSLYDCTELSSVHFSIVTAKLFRFVSLSWDIPMYYLHIQRNRNQI